MTFMKYTHRFHILCIDWYRKWPAFERFSRRRKMLYEDNLDRVLVVWGVTFRIEMKAMTCKIHGLQKPFSVNRGLIHHVGSTPILSYLRVQCQDTLIPSPGKVSILPLPKFFDVFLRIVLQDSLEKDWQIPISTMRIDWFLKWSVHGKNLYRYQ